jgi:hypothetical protein
MRSHEHYEEYKLYPFLQRRFGDSTECLERGHQQLHAAVDRVRAAYTGLESAEISSALRAHDAVLLEHLDQEEELVIPRLLELAPDEFDAYYRS